ncbi:MAG: hypothetical protein J6T72_02775 [Alphaproteobacteria bacterium]|nr:hypothetical protein [Alphaproteobacteria bacterium]
MKNKLIIFLTCAMLAFSTNAEAFMLPPFKTDIAGTLQKYFTIINTKVQTVKDKIKESTDLQGIIQKGKDAIAEVKEYAAKVRNVVDKVKGLNLSNIAGEFSKINETMSSTKLQFNMEELNISKEYNSKLSSIEDNIRKLEEDTLKNSTDQNKVTQNMARIKQLNSQRGELKQQLSGKLDGVKDKLSSSLSSLKGLKDKALASLKSLSFDNIQILSKNYDSSEDLNEVFNTLTPPKGTEITPSVIASYNTNYKKFWLSDAVAVTNRISTVRSEVTEDNEDAGKLTEQVANMEGSNSAKITALVEGRKKNMHALITYTEMVLLKLKIDVAQDLMKGSFEAIDPSAIEDFDFNNYRVTDEDIQQDEANDNETSPSSTDTTSGEALPEDIVNESIQAMQDSMDAINKYSTSNRVGK